MAFLYGKKKIVIIIISKVCKCSIPFEEKEDERVKYTRKIYTHVRKNNVNKLRTQRASLMSSWEEKKIKRLRKIAVVMITTLN